MVFEKLFLDSLAENTRQGLLELTGGTLRRISCYNLSVYLLAIHLLYTKVPLHRTVSIHF